MFQDVSEL